MARPGFGGMPNMQQLMKQAQKMQKQMEEAQAKIGEAEVTATVGLKLSLQVIKKLNLLQSNQTL